MSVEEKTADSNYSQSANEEQWPGISSRYLLIIVATLRNKQLVRGSLPRIEANPRKRRNTSIALEEVKQGLVPFTTSDAQRQKNGDSK
ncbi:MAG: DNA-directed RNA polymerase subunit omega [Pyrinomonadaceae bacterium]